MTKFNGLGMNMGNLWRLSDAKTRSISPENFDGAKGKGGMATLEEGSARWAARELGQGWKVNPYIIIQPGEIFTIADIEGPGAIQHIWMTPTGNWRNTIMRIYWDGLEHPSVECPLGTSLLVDGANMLRFPLLQFALILAVPLTATGRCL